MNEYISEDLDEELTRIRESGEAHLEYIPVHYIIGGNSSGSRENMMNVLLSELKKYNRIFQNRYSVLHIYDTRCDINKIADELSGFLKSVTEVQSFSVLKKKYKFIMTDVHLFRIC